MIKQITFAVIGDRLTLADWKIKCIKELCKIPNVTFGLYIVNQSNHLRKKSILHSLYSFFIEKKSKALQKKHISEITNNIVHYQSGYKLPKNQLDFILDFGTSSTPTELIDAAKYGVWSFYFGNQNLTISKSIPFFTAIMNNQPIYSYLIQKHSNNYILHHGCFAVLNHSCTKTIDSVYYLSLDFPARICKELLTSSELNKKEPFDSTLQKSNQLQSKQIIHFLFHLLKNKLNYYKKKLFYVDQWNIGIIHQPIHNCLEQNFHPEIYWFPKTKKGAFIADPFMMLEDKHFTCLYEEFDIRDGKGELTATTISFENNEMKKINSKKISDQFIKNIHLSYPYLFKHEQDIYCVPETNHARQVIVYKAKPFPYRWIEVTTIIHDFAAVDPTIFHYEGYWWLFCTNQNEDAQSKLYAWYSRDLFTGWTPHALNPIKSDVTSSRPGGAPFFYKQKLYRPAQDCSTTYGGKIVINEILELTPNRFNEKPVSILEPFLHTPYTEGIHTLSSCENITIIDAKKSLFFMQKPFIHLLKIIKNN